MNTTIIHTQSPEFHALPVFFISLIAVSTGLVWALIFGRGDRRRTVTLVLGVAAVLIVSAALARSGKLATFGRVPPPMAIMMVTVLLGSLALGLSRFGSDAAWRVSLVELIGLQAFRLPLEQVMHLGGERGIVPVEMTYAGYNFDIVTGFGAVLLLIAFKRKRNVPRLAVWIWNVWGMAALAVIAVVAVMSSPMFRAFGEDPAHVNTWVLFPPYVWVPTVLVPIAISSHIIITRKLLREGRR